MAITKMGKSHKRTRKSYLQSDLSEYDLSLSLPPILPEASTIRCSFSSVMVSERASPGRIGKSPEGHRNIYYFTPKIRVPLRAPQADAKRANAKK